MSHVGSTSYITHLNQDLSCRFKVLRGENFGEDESKCCLEVKNRDLKERWGKIRCFSKSTNGTI